MRILLVAPPKKGLMHSEEHPPIGLGYLATALAKLGHTPDIQDCIINNWGFNDLDSYINKTQPDITAITTFSQASSSVKEILSRVKANHPKIITVIGGPHPTAVPKKTLLEFKNADYAVAGEGEIPLQKLLLFLDKKSGQLENIPGLIWRENDQIRHNPKIEQENIDEFGHPAWDLIDPSKYFSSPGIGDKTTVIHTGRGCPFNCEFCVTLGKKLRHNSLEHIYQEIRFLYHKYGIKRFSINNEGFTVDVDFVKKFCRYMIKKNDNFSYSSGTGLRLNTLDDEMLELMKKANFSTLICVGIESGVERVRKLMQKNLKQEDIYKGIALLKKHGFKISANFIIGFPGETKQEIQATIELALKLKLQGAAFTHFLPLPGTAATKKLIENGEISQDFDYSQIDLDSVLYAPKGMTTHQVDKIRKKAVFRFNSQPHMLLYHLSGGRLSWSIVKTLRIFFPRTLVPEKWRKTVKGQ